MQAGDVDRFAGAFLLAAGVPVRPPTRLGRLARALGVASIELADIAEDGRVELHSGAARVFVRADMSKARQRFTLAHELAHLMLAAPGDALVAHRDPPVRTDEERLCDQIAGALVIPADWLRSEHGRAPRRVATVKRVSLQTRTSLAASIVRLNEALGWRRALLRWQLTPRGWRIVSSAGVPPAVRGRVNSATATRDLLDAVAGASGAWERHVRLPLLIAGDESAFPASVQVRGRSALALVDLRAVAR